MAIGNNGQFKWLLGGRPIAMLTGPNGGQNEGRVDSTRASEFGDTEVSVEGYASERLEAAPGKIQNHRLDRRISRPFRGDMLRVLFPTSVGMIRLIDS